MTDFFADLERQLTAATVDRPRRMRRARARRGAALAAVLLAIVAGGAGLATAVSGDGTGTRGTPAAPDVTQRARTAPAPAVAAAPPVDDARTLNRFVTAVLSATSRPGMARGVANQLQRSGARIGNVTNAADQTQAETIVTYAPGHASDAALVAQHLYDDARRRAPVVRPATTSERAVAGAEAAVIVLAGAQVLRTP
jgi:hypothetical protein